MFQRSWLQGNKILFRTEWKEKPSMSKLWGESKAVFRGKQTAFNTFIRKEKRFQIKNTISHRKWLKKRSTTKETQPAVLPCSGHSKWMGWTHPLTTGSNVEMDDAADHKEGRKFQDLNHGDSTEAPKWILAAWGCQEGRPVRGFYRGHWVGPRQGSPLLR